ncbi:MAG: hypothetical protein O3A63_06120 [Proteobacteria bacterium]|nr:hypothetical protein [Pseudomonadota bacterium]
MAKTLELANIKLSSVVTDIMGRTGRLILEALIQGTEDPEILAQLAKGSLRSKRAQLQEAVVGRMTPHYRFLLAQQLRVIDDLSGHVDELDVRIEECISPFAEACAIVESMPGIAQRSAQVIVAEIGVDMTRFPPQSTQRA